MTDTQNTESPANLPTPQSGSAGLSAAISELASWIPSLQKMDNLDGAGTTPDYVIEAIEAVQKAAAAPQSGSALELAAVKLHDLIQTAVGNEQAREHAHEVNDRNAEHDFKRMHDDALQEALKVVTKLAATLSSPETETDSITVSPYMPKPGEEAKGIDTDYVAPLRSANASPESDSAEEARVADTGPETFNDDEELFYLPIAFDLTGPKKDGYSILTEREKYIANRVAERNFVLGRAATKDSAAGVGEWLPTESAPKDGTRIQVGWTGDLVGHARSAEWSTEYDRACWVDSLGGEPIEPTHWMPLPKPPVTPTPAEGGQS